jgi:hypothetical protein
LTTESLVDVVMEETGGQGVDFLLETVPLTEQLSTTTSAGLHELTPSCTSFAHARAHN